MEKLESVGMFITTLLATCMIDTFFLGADSSSFSSLLLYPLSPPIAASSGSNSPYSANSSPSKTKGGTLRQVEIFKIAEPCPLIDPSQVVITKGEIFVADPVLTPIGNARNA